MRARDASQYLRFAGERTRPALDLLAWQAHVFPAQVDGKVLLPYAGLFFIAKPR